MSRRKPAEKCEGLDNPFPDKHCVEGSRKKDGYYCLYCDKVMDKNYSDTPRPVKQGDNPGFVLTPNKPNPQTKQPNPQTKQPISQTISQPKPSRKLDVGDSQIEHSKRLCNELFSIHSDKIKGKKVEPLILGIIYYVCENSGLGYTHKNLSDFLGVEVGDVKKGYKNIKKIFPHNQMSVNNIETHLVKCCTILGLGKYRMECLSIVDYVQNVLEGRQPQTLAVVIIFFICRYHNDLSGLEDGISKKCDLSIQNVKTALKLLDSHKHKLENILEKDK
ncbi:TFIIB-type domain-containing protein [Entamoeba marina]